MVTWRNDDSPALNVNGEHASYRLELWHRGDAPQHVTLAGDDLDEVTIHVDDLERVANALLDMAAEADEVAVPFGREGQEPTW